MVLLEEILSFFRTRFPEELKEEWDNVGLMTGDENQDISKVLVTLDVTQDTVQEAISFGAELIISHHPLIFSPIKSITEDTVSGSLIRQLIKNDISVYSMHTNFDKAKGGMNDLLAEKLGLLNIREYFEDELLTPEGKKLDNIGRVGKLPSPMTLDDLADFVKASLGSTAIKIFGDGDEMIESVALCTGSGGSMLYSAFNSGADAYITSDLGHHHAQTASEIGLNMIDAGHFETENIITEYLYDVLNSEFPDLLIKKSDAKPYYRSI